MFVLSLPYMQRCVTSSLTVMLLLLYMTQFSGIQGFVAMHLRLVLLCYVMLCYVMLCYVMLCYVMLCCVMLCYVMLCYVMLCYVMLCYVMLCYVVLCIDKLLIIFICNFRTIRAGFSSVTCTTKF